MLKPVFCSLKIHDTDRNVPEQTPSASFDHANKYFLQKIDFAPHTFPNQIPSDRFKYFPNQTVPDHFRLSHGHHTEHNYTRKRKCDKFQLRCITCLQYYDCRTKSTAYLEKQANVTHWYMDQDANLSSPRSELKILKERSAEAKTP